MSSRNNVRIGVFGTFGFENMGDAAVADATISGLKRYIPNASIVAICQQPENVKLRHGIDAYSIHRVFLTKAETEWSHIDNCVCDESMRESFKACIVSFLKKTKALYLLTKLLVKCVKGVDAFFRELIFSFKIFKIVRNLDLIVMSGSGQLNEEWGGPWRYPFGLFRWVLLARLARCKVAFLSVGAGEIISPWSRFFCSTALRFAQYRSTRDSRTLELIKSWNIEDVHLVPDMAFSMLFEKKKNPENITGSLVIGINPIPFCDPRTWNITDQAKYDQYVEKLSGFCNWVLSNGNSVLFVPNELMMDNLTIDDIVNKIDVDCQDTNKIIRPNVENYNDVFNSLSLCDCVVCSRFHGLLFSLMSQKPVIVLAHHYKFHQLSREMNLGEFCHDIDLFEESVLYEQVSQIVENMDAIKINISERMADYSSQVEKQYLLMKKFVN